MTEKSNKSPICVGAGLIALDVVLNGNPRTPLKVFAGGSCGNVITILSYLNWVTFPVARLKINEAAEELLSDLRIWNVRTAMVTRTEDGSTPIIIHRIKRDKNGNSIHRFEFKNPDTGRWLPSFKPVLLKEVEELTKKCESPDVFYFDRQTPSSIKLAKYYKSKGSLIFFEPSSIVDISTFMKCLKLADIIKFSSERVKEYSTTFKKQQVPLEIETLGINGLRYRFSQNLTCRKWTHIPSFKVGFVVDAAGAGDWCSAGIISQIGNKGKRGFDKINLKVLRNALRFGQALGALNCFFDGARGSMYNLDKKRLNSFIKVIQSNNTTSIIKTTPLVFKRKKIDINKLY
jgi:fructokinase